MKIISLVKLCVRRSGYILEWKTCIWAIKLPLIRVTIKKKCITVQISWVRPKRVFFKLDIIKVNESRKFWKSIKPFFSDKGVNYNKMMLNENNQIISDEATIADTMSRLKNYSKLYTFWKKNKGSLSYNILVKILKMFSKCFLPYLTRFINFYPATSSFREEL